MITLIKGGQVVNPRLGTVEKKDLLIENGMVARVFSKGGSGEVSGVSMTIDAAGKVIVPGLVDIHTHLREPGYEYKETIASGTMAAVAGGYSAMACMPNTSPPNDCRSVTEFIIEQSKRADRARVYPIATISKGQKGESLIDFCELAAAGAVGVSDDGFPVVNSELMRRALEYAHYCGLAVISHCEDPNLSKGGVMHEGEISTRIGLPGVSGASEDIFVYREISLARLTGCPVHIAHVSTGVSVELIRHAKEEGLPVTAETAPHYFTLDHGLLVTYDTRYKVNPPLRTSKDVSEIRKGLEEGVIDVIATDHAPHDSLEKEVEFDKAAFGMIGLQTALPLTLELVRDGVLTLPEAISKLSSNGADILGVPGGELKEGANADVAIIDMESEYCFEERDILSKSRNSPFLGRMMKGRCDLTMVGGKIVYQRNL
ncbi:amidohydrolase family protein [delta proteobacterium NaphS2]|nr:amidohydrolase family protein [delta proteobacterium NaphS2]